MLTVDIALPDVEELHRLVADGKEKGFLSYDEIVTGLEEVDLTKEQVEDFYTYLIDHGVELMEGETHKRPPHEQQQLTVEEEKAAIGRVNKAAIEDVVYAPTGFFLTYTAWRKNVSGIAKGPLPFFWGVSKTA